MVDGHLDGEGEAYWRTAVVVEAADDWIGEGDRSLRKRELVQRRMN